MKLPPEQFAIAKWRGAYLYKVNGKYVCTWNKSEAVDGKPQNGRCLVEHQGNWPACAPELADGQRMRFTEAIESMTGLTL